MIYLPKRTQGIYAHIAGAPATNQPTFHANGVTGVLAGATPVKLIGGGGKKQEFDVEDIVIYNADTAAVVLTVLIRDGNTDVIIKTETLAVGQKFMPLAGGTSAATIIGGVTNGDNHDHAGGDGAQLDHGYLSNLTNVAHHPGYALLATGRAFTGAQTFNALVTMTSGFALGAGAKVAHMADVDATIAAGDVGDATAIAALFTAYGEKINAILAALETQTLVATS